MRSRALEKEHLQQKPTTNEEGDVRNWRYTSRGFPFIPVFGRQGLLIRTSFNAVSSLPRNVLWHRPIHSLTAGNEAMPCGEQTTQSSPQKKGGLAKKLLNAAHPRRTSLGRFTRAPTVRADVNLYLQNCVHEARVAQVDQSGTPSCRTNPRVHLQHTAYT